MSAGLAWVIDGPRTPSIWIRDPLTPTLPGRLWLEPVAAVGSGITDYSITSKSQGFNYRIIDQSGGLPANFDNALRVTNLAPLLMRMKASRLHPYG